MRVTTILIPFVSMTLWCQSRPIPVHFVWENGELVFLDAKNPFIERLEGGATVKYPIKPLGDDGVVVAVDYQDDALWSNTYLEDPAILPIAVHRQTVSGAREEVGTMRDPSIRGVTIMPLRNGKFIGFVGNLQYSKTQAPNEKYGPIAYFATSGAAEKAKNLLRTGWGDLHLAKPYYKPTIKTQESFYNYPSLFDEISGDPCPFRAGDNIVLPSYPTGFLFVFSAEDGRFRRTIDFFRIGEEALLKNSFDGAALIALLPTKDDRLLVIHRPAVSMGSPVRVVGDGTLSAEAVSAQLEGYVRSIEDNATRNSMLGFTVLNLETGERSSYGGATDWVDGADLILGKVRLRFSADEKLCKTN